MDFHLVKRMIYLTDFPTKSHRFLFQFLKVFQIMDLDLLKKGPHICFKVSIIVVAKIAFQIIYGFLYEELSIVCKAS